MLSENISTTNIIAHNILNNIFSRFNQSPKNINLDSPASFSNLII